ncbi:MAG: hypothetical protein LBU14_06760 [Candidatus Peribacteria bacterium]|jgi:hypothetical protein|nr:hypothetical protein [Candidatus Peribacteria bacterium]
MTGNIPSTDITSLDKNIISYNKNNNEWNLKRVCKSITCIPTYSKKINFDNDSDTVYLLR